MASPTIRSNVQPIYDMHQRWLSEVLSTDSSLLTPGADIWTLEHLDELEEHSLRYAGSCGGTKLQWRQHRRPSQQKFWTA